MNEVWAFLGLPPAPARGAASGTTTCRPRTFDPATRQRLQEQLGDHNRGLEELLGAACPGRPASSRFDGLVSSGMLVNPRILSGRTVERAALAVGHRRGRHPGPARAAGTCGTQIVGQSYPGDIECVVVFDQSSPAALPADVPARPATAGGGQHPHPGLAGARNSGISGSDGALIALCDDDDEWDAGQTAAPGRAAGIGGRGLRRVRGAYPSRYRADRAGTAAVGGSWPTGAQRVSALHPSTFVIAAGALPRWVWSTSRSRAATARTTTGCCARPRLGPIVAVGQPLAEVYWHRAVVLRRALADHRRRAHLPARASILS